MAYWLDRWKFLNSIEFEYKFAGNYGAKGEKRAKREKATPEQIKKQNQQNRETKVRRLIKANFYPEDYWVCLKYKEGQRPTPEEVKKDIDKFIDGMRKEYKKRDELFKFVKRLEIGKHGGVHIHILFNRIGGKPACDLLAKKMWRPKRPSGGIHYRTLTEEGGYEKLANYIVKPLEEEADEQLSFFPEEDRKQFASYSTSRNLVRPQPERKKYWSWTVEKLIRNGVKPQKGFYIPEESIKVGVNRYTGMSYLKYTEVRINEITSRGQPEGG